MLSRLFKILLLVLLLASIPSIFLMRNVNNNVVYPTVFNLNATDKNWIETSLNKLSLQEKCAQMVIPYANSTDTSNNSDDLQRLVKLVENYKVGGFAFFKGTIENQTKIVNLLQSKSKLPLLISADYERGIGMRLEDAVEFPYNMAFGAADDPNLTYLMGRITSTRGRQIGVHQNYAPLVDVNRDSKNPIINIRAFAENPFNIAVHASAFIRGMNQGRMLSTAKHFPGHGSTDADSHSELPIVNISKEEFERNDLIPFMEAIDAGVKSIMIGHLEVPAYESEPGLPATFSKKIVTDLLIKELNFDGLIITDALNMHAITNNFSDSEAVTRSVQAGNDLLLFPPNDSTAIFSLVNAVKKGVITEGRIDYSVRKILSAKRWLGLNDRTKIISDKQIESKIEFERTAMLTARKSITLLKDDKNLIPLKAQKNSKIISIALTDLDRERDLENPILFGELVKSAFPKSKTENLFLKDRKKRINEVYKLAKKSKIILLPIYASVKSFNSSISIDEKYLAFIKRLEKLNKPIIAMSFGNPYIMKDLQGLDVLFECYGSADASERAMVDVLMGKVGIAGKLPVSIPETKFVRGSGIQKQIVNVEVLSDYSDSLYNFENVEQLMNKAIADTVFPGGVLLIGRNNKIIFNKAFGHYTYDSTSQKMTTQTIFDLASVSKVIGTTSAAMLLYDDGLLDLDKNVMDYLPEFGNNGKEIITIRNLLMHNSGLPAWKPFYTKYTKAGDVIKGIMQMPLEFSPGTKYLYSDLGMITLQKVIEKITGKGLDKFLENRFFRKMGLKNTFYSPPQKIKNKCAPTEIDNYWRMKLIQGSVHDETASLLNGIAGHAGLFSTAGDLAKVMCMLMNNGRTNNEQLIKSRTIRNWTTVQSEQSTRGLGWDTKSATRSSAGTKFSMQSFGHTGFTGTSIWADKTRNLFVILLTNRVYPTRSNRRIIKFRPILHDAIIDDIDVF